MYRIGYPNVAAQFDNDPWIREFVKNVLANRTRIAKPRLLARVIVDELEQARLKGTADYQTSNMERLVNQAAAQVIREESQE